MTIKDLIEELQKHDPTTKVGLMLHRKDNPAQVIAAIHPQVNNYFPGTIFIHAIAEYDTRDVPREMWPK